MGVAAAQVLLPLLLKHPVEADAALDKLAPSARARSPSAASPAPPSPPGSGSSCPGSSPSRARQGRERAGLNPEGKQRLSFHDLRHSYGSHLLRQGVDTVQVSKALSHSKVSTTLDIYAHVIEELKSTEELDARLHAAFGSVL